MFPRSYTGKPLDLQGANHRMLYLITFLYLD